ncbi:inclusion membrane protein IncB [Chlamydia buteonis]|uniref:inclusion membrane protein IncB n=1 Tax=Chlamydia buteonis TaxID=2494525 RepID=UPI003450341C
MSTTPLSSSSQSHDQEGLNRVLLSFDGRIKALDKRVKEIDEGISLLDRSASQAVATGNNVASNMVLLKDEVDSLKGCLSTITELLFESRADRKMGSSHSEGDTTYIIGATPPSTCSKLAAVVLTLLALIAITMFVICIVSVCGDFPLFISLLNMYTVGACISLPIISCASVSVMILCTISITSLLRSRPAIYMVNNSQIEA